MEHSDFLNELKLIISKAENFSEKARREGILALEEELDENNCRDDIYSYGTRFVIDGTDYGLVDKILSNIISHETDPKVKLLKIIQKEAVLAMQQGMNTRLLMPLLFSFIDGNTLSALKEILSDNDGRIKEWLE